MSFLPDDYQAPRNSGFYAKLNPGENKFRILSRPILGWEDWIDNKPIRYQFDKKPKASYDVKKPLRHFWSMIVWNYSEEQIQILHITQATIRNNIEALTKDSDWGLPYFYDIKIIKSGEKTDTEYVVNPLPHKPIGQHIIDAFHDRKCNLEAMYDNGDPFGIWEHYTPAAFEEVPNSNKITNEQLQKLGAVLADCEPGYVARLQDKLQKKPYMIKDMADMPISLFDSIYGSVLKNKNEYQARLHGE